MNTDWNSPQGDFDTAEKQGELLMLLSRQQVTAAALKRCWQAAKPDAALPAGSRLELVCWDPVQNRKVQLPAE